MTKVALIGLDAAVPSLVQKFAKMGRLPNIQRLIKEGVWAEGIPVFPTHTASNWNTVSTGAWPKTHGVTDMVVHLPGRPLTEIESGFYSTLCQAEHLWETVERQGKKNILLKYIGSWPPTIKNSIQIEGFGAPGGPGSRPWGSSPLSVANSSCYSTEALENANVVRILTPDSQSWKNLPQSYLPLLETEIRIGSIGGVNYNVLIMASDPSSDYDSVLISKGKDARTGIKLKKGEISSWQIEDFHVNGNTVKGAFRMKLINIGSKSSRSDKMRFKLFVSQVFPMNGWCFPDSLASELTTRFGPFLESISHFPFVFGWIDEYTYLDDVSYQAKWMGNATKYLMSKYGWDLYMTQWHGIDNTQHAFLRFDKSVLTQYEAEVCDRVVLRTYEIADSLVGDILDALTVPQNGKSNSDEIYTFVISDHGHVMGKRRFFINAYLYQKGFIKLKEDPATHKLTIDWANTQAFAQGMVHVYVNLKGRDPQGSVNPGTEYEKVAERLIDALYEIKDPETGLRPIILALGNKDAEFLGLSGQRAGDVIVAANSVYALDNRVRISEDLFEDLKVGFKDASIHGSQLPSVDMGEHGTIKSMFVAQGPRIKKGYLREKPINMVDIAPTIAHILGIPPPKDSEGAVMHDLFV